MVSIKIKEIPKIDRPRERLIAKGSHCLSDEELLAIILTGGTANVSAKELAGEVIKYCGGLDKLSNVSYPELLTLLNSVRLTEIITSLTDNKKPKVEITGYNELILEYLKTNKKIASYHQEGDSYRIYSRKHR